MGAKLPARNDLCLCGSGLKYKKCCGKSGHLPLAQEFSPAPVPKPDIAAHLPQILAASGEGRLVDALRLCKLLLEHYPEHPQVLFTTGYVMYLSGMKEGALNLLLKASNLSPTHHQSFALIAVILQEVRQYDKALPYIEKALELQPKDTEYRDIYAQLLATKMENRPKVKELYRALIADNPQYWPPYRALYTILMEEMAFEEAGLVFAEILAKNPPPEQLLPLLSVVPRIYFTREQITEARERFSENLTRLEAANITLPKPEVVLREVNFSFAYHAENNRDLLVRMADMYRKIFPSLSVTAPHLQQKYTPEKPIKLGFLSSLFRKEHSVMRCLELFLHIMMQDQRFEVVIFDIGSSTESSEGELSFLKEGLCRQVKLPNSSLSMMQEMIAEEALDVLVYLDIGMDARSYMLAFARLARIQCCLAGHPITTGISTMDYYISSELWEAPNAQDFYSEKLVRLQNPLLYYTKPAEGGELLSREEYGLPAQGKLYVFPATLHKMHPDIYTLAVKLLARDPEAVIVFFEFGTIDHTVIMRRFAELAPGESHRIHFNKWLSNQHFSGAMRRCDAVCDPLHFGLSTTLYQLLAANLPVVTWTGEFLHGRIATGLYHRMGVEGLIAGNMEEYVEIAYRLAHDTAFRTQKEQEIKAKNAVIFGDTGAAGEFGDWMVERLNACASLSF